MDPRSAAHLNQRWDQLRSKIEQAIEGLRGLDRKLERVGNDTRDRFRKLDRELLRFDARISGRRRRRPGR